MATSFGQIIYQIKLLFLLPIVPEDFELPVSPQLEANLVNMPLNETTSALFRKR